jgi:hypothetical protein
MRFTSSSLNLDTALLIVLGGIRKRFGVRVFPCLTQNIVYASCTFIGFCFI